MSEWEYIIITDSNMDGLERSINEAAGHRWEPINITVESKSGHFPYSKAHCLARRLK